MVVSHFEHNISRKFSLVRFYYLGKRKHADIIEEIIAKSKQAKYQRKVEKDEAMEKTEKLDDEWHSLAGLLGGIRPAKKDEVNAHSFVSRYRSRVTGQRRIPLMIRATCVQATLARCGPPHLAQGATAGSRGRPDKDRRQ